MSRYLGVETPFGVAHRGGALEALENTPTAFHRAIELGYRVIETDVQATADGKLVVVHDGDTARISTHVVEISRVTWDVLSRVELLNGDRLWLLDELLAFLPTDCRLNIDPKSDSAVTPLIALFKGRPELLKRICVGSFSSARLRQLRNAVPGLSSSLGMREMALLVLAFVSRRNPQNIKKRLPSGVVAVQVHAQAYGFNFTSPAFIQFIHQLGLDIHVWTIDSEQDMQGIYACGADAVMTDRPSILKKVLHELGHWKGE